MNLSHVSAELQPIVEEITRRFKDRIDSWSAPHVNEIYFHARMELVPGFCAHLYRNWNARLVTVFADDARTGDGTFHLYYVLALDAAHGFIILRVPVSPEAPEFTSLANAIPAVNWQEREVQDLFGLKVIGHPNPRRCALHDDWPEVYPLRKDFDLKTVLPPFQGERHKFRKVEGEGVFQVPVGPVHAGIIEPGHFLFSVAGEPVLYLQLRLFYVHKGTEKLFESLPVPHCVRLAESISGDSSFAHATAFCHAVERAAGVEAPLRARVFRSVCLELERLYNHIADIGSICTDVAFVTANMHAMRLKERILRVNEHLTGSRLLRGMACLGGVRLDWDADQLKALGELVEWLRPEFDSLVRLVENSSSTLDRLETTGTLKPEVARDLGVVGIAGRASGFDHDLRRDSSRRLRTGQSQRAGLSGGRRETPPAGAGGRGAEIPSSSGGSPRSCPPAPYARKWGSCLLIESLSATSKGGAAKSSTGFAPRRATGWRDARSRTRHCRTGRS
jgi:Ni,Fe-hydrogenase III component G